MDEKSPRRKWYRLHLSTWAVILLLLGFFIVVEIPGEIGYEMIAEGVSLSGGGGMVFGETFSHGWPWAYLDRYGGTSPGNASDIPWLVPRAWKFWSQDKSNLFEFTFSPFYLFLDMLVCLAIICIAASLFEWRRRYRTRLFQFTLRELLLLVLIVAGVFSWWRVHHNRRMRELELVKSYRLGMSWVEEYRGPKILAKLLGTERLDDFKLQTEYDCDSVFYQTEVVQCILRLKECAGLEKITIGDGIYEQQGFVTDEMLAELTPLTNLHSLDIPCSKITDTGMETISRFPRLTVLRIPRTAITTRGVRLLESLPLESLDLSNTRIDDAAVESLLRMKNLAVLDISGTEITEDGYRELEAKLPNCIITYQ